MDLANITNYAAMHYHLQNPTIEATSYPEKLALDTALCIINKGDVAKELPDKYGITLEQYQAIATQSLFKRAVQYYEGYVNESGLSFKLKCRMACDALLPDMINLIRDGDTPASAKTDMYKQLSQLADYVPKRESNSLNVNGEGGGFNLNIIFGSHDGNNYPTVAVAATMPATADPVSPMREVNPGNQTVVAVPEHLPPADSSRPTLPVGTPGTPEQPEFAAPVFAQEP